MQQITIPVPTLSGKKTYLVGIALVFAGISQIFNDLGTGVLLPMDFMALVGHAGAQKILEGLAFIAVRLGLKKTNGKDVAADVLNQLKEDRQ